MPQDDPSLPINPSPFAPARSQAEWDAQGWTTESEPLTAVARLETTVSIRFDPDSARLLRTAVRLTGMTQSAFIRRATISAAEHTIAGTQVPAVLRRVAETTAPPVRTSTVSGLEFASTPSRTRLRTHLQLDDTP